MEKVDNGSRPGLEIDGLRLIEETPDSLSFVTGRAQDNTIRITQGFVRGGRLRKRLLVHQMGLAFVNLWTKRTGLSTLEDLPRELMSGFFQGEASLVGLRGCPSMSRLGLLDCMNLVSLAGIPRSLALDQLTIDPIPPGLLTNGFQDIPAVQQLTLTWVPELPLLWAIPLTNVILLNHLIEPLPHLGLRRSERHPAMDVINDAKYGMIHQGWGVNRATMWAQNQLIKEGYPGNARMR